MFFILQCKPGTSMAVNTHRLFKNRHALVQRWHSSPDGLILSSRVMLAVLKSSLEHAGGNQKSFKAEGGDKGCDLNKGEWLLLSESSSGEKGKPRGRNVEFYRTINLAPVTFY